MIQYDVSDGVRVLRLSAPPLNTITFALLEHLRTAIRRANRETEVRGVVIMGGPRHFSAGADIAIFRDITCAEDAIRASRIFQDTFQEVEDSEKPVVAAVAGKVLGGALELALACHFRVCSKDTSFSMPEVDLGANPGAGGTQRLPRLVGPEPALKMMLTARMIDAQQALALGLVDAVCEGESLLERAQALLRPDSTPRKTSRRTEKINDTPTNDAALDQACKLLESVRPEYIAPQKIVEAVRAGLEESFQAGLRKEREVFAECIRSSATQNKMYLYFATCQASIVPRVPGARPSKITRAAVVGTGAMARGIAQLLATAGITVDVCDEDPTTGWPEMADTDLVIESVPEDVSTKHSVIARLEELCPADTIIACNTSTISLDALAEGMQHGERLIGMHFFNPVDRMPLVEIIRRDATPERVVATALRFAGTLRKTPVVVKSREGFLVNRLLIPYLKEAFWLLEDGADAPAIDSTMVEFGFAAGPLVMADMAGLDTLEQADGALSRAFPRQGGLPPIVARLVEHGHLGQKRASGVYTYREGAYTPRVSEAARRIIGEVREGGGHAAGEIGKEEIIRRLVLRMAGEAFYVIEEGIIQRESDLDVATVLAMGFPDFRGGVLKYARGLGLDRVLGQLERLAERFGERFLPCQLLRET